MHFPVRTDISSFTLSILVLKYFRMLGKNSSAQSIRKASVVKLLDFEPLRGIMNHKPAAVTFVQPSNFCLNNSSYPARPHSIIVYCFDSETSRGKIVVITF